mgnify:CR=1 FL=1
MIVFDEGDDHRRGCAKWISEIIDRTKTRFKGIFDSEKGVDQDPFSFPQAPSAGDWGGIAFTRQLDSERSERWDNEDDLTIKRVAKDGLIFENGTVWRFEECINPVTVVFFM